MNASVGIITRTKNRPALLRRALESVINQSYEDWRMVVVNDGGDPADVDRLVERYTSQVKDRISVVHNPVSLGMEAASNRGISTIRTRYLAIHDDDDSWAPEFLTIAVAELERIRETFPSVAGVITLANSVFERVDGKIVRIDRTEPYWTSDKRGLVSLDELLITNQFAPIQFLFRYDAAEEIGFFRTDLPVLGDWDFNVRFMCRYDIFIVPQFLAFYHHRVSDQGIYGNSIHAHRSRHELYATRLKNEWLRKDLRGSGTGIGTHIAMRQAVRDLRQRVEELARNTGAQHAQRVPVPSALLQGLIGRRVIRIRQLFSLWAASGRRLHYAKKLFEVLSSEGPGAAVQRVKLWFFARHGN